MDSEKIVIQENITNPIIFNNYSIQNLIISPLDIQAYNKSPINMKKIFIKPTKIICTTPKKKFVKKKFNQEIQLINPIQKITPIISKKNKNNFDFINFNKVSKENGRNYNKLIYNNINAKTENNSKERRPLDSVKKRKTIENYTSKINMKQKKILKISLSQETIKKPKKKIKMNNILLIKGIKDTSNKSFIQERKSNTNYPEDTKMPKNHKNPNILNLEEFIYDKQIGSGTFGKIYSVKWVKDQKNYAIKKEIITDDYFINNRLKACKIIQSFLKKTGNKDIIYLYCNLCYKIRSKNKGNNLNDENINNKDNIQYEYYELMELAEMDWEKEINERRKISKYYTQKELLDIIFQLISALSALQKNHITHRDIKPQNILILKGKYKLCDFDEIRKLEKDGLIVQRVRGSELYMSPILFNGLHQNLIQVKHNTYKSDVFSLGMCLFYAASLTYGGVDSIRELNDMNEIKKIIFSYLGSRYSEKLILLILTMLEIDENKRPNFIQLEELLEKYFFKNSN